MAVRRYRCFTPGRRLTPENARTFGKEIAELPIVLDYLEQMYGWTFNTSARPTAVDWWDAALRPDYWAMLLQRHPETSETMLRADKTLCWPDISTYRGRFARRGLVQKPGERNEIYQIKPHNQNGIDDGIENLRRVHLSYRRHGIPGTYKSGTWYPEQNPTKVKLRGSWALRENFAYAMEIFRRRHKARILDVYLRVERTNAGLLLYKFCVEFERPDNWTRIRDTACAYSVLASFFTCYTADREAQAKEAASTFMRTQVPDDEEFLGAGRVPEIVATGEAEKVPRIRVSALELIEELKSLVPAIEDALYTRLKGLPGEEYLLCCDETFIRSQILEPRARKMRAQVKLLGSQTAVQYASGRTLISAAPAVAVTGFEIANAAKDYGAEIAQYAAAHPRDTFIIAGGIIVVTAVVALAFEAIVPIAGAMEVASVGTLEGTAIVGSGEAAGVGGARVLGTGLGRSVVAKSTVPASAPAALPETLGARIRIAQLIRIAPEAAAEYAEREAGIGEVLKLIEETVGKEAVKKAITLGAFFLVALGATTAYAAKPTRTEAPETVRSSGGRSLRLGRLFVTRLAQSPYHLARPLPIQPKLEQEFDFGKLTDDFAALTKATAEGGNTRAFYLGRLKIE